ncbi:hypothetical protein GQ457_08G026510 [Hibiscus cannabinus]
MIGGVYSFVLPFYKISPSPFLEHPPPFPPSPCISFNHRPPASGQPCGTRPPSPASLASCESSRATTSCSFLPFESSTTESHSNHLLIFELPCTVVNPSDSLCSAFELLLVLPCVVVSLRVRRWNRFCG